MRGQQHLIAMRRRRMRPGMALVDLVPAYTVASAEWPHYTAVAHLEIADDEAVCRADLRCLAGIPAVCCSGFDGQRLRALHDACIAAGAGRVFSTLYATGKRGDLVALDSLASWVPDPKNG